MTLLLWLFLGTSGVLVAMALWVLWWACPAERRRRLQRWGILPPDDNGDTT